MTDPVTELHALHVLDVLEAAQQTVDEWRKFVPSGNLEPWIDTLEDALMRLDRLEVVTTAAA